MRKRTGVIVAAVITCVGTIAATALTVFVGAKTDTLHVVVGPAPAQTVTVTAAAAPPLPGPTVTVTVPGEPIAPAPSADSIASPSGSILLADMRGSGSSFHSDTVKIDGVSHPGTVRIGLAACAGGDRRQSTWTWEGDMARLVGKIGLTDESFNSAVASLSVYEGNGVNELIKRFPASIDGLTDVDVPLTGVYTMTLVAEADASGSGCTGATLAFLDAKLERPDSG